MLYQRDFDHWSSPILSESCWGKLLQAERLEGGVCGDRDCTFLEFLTESFLLFLPTLPTLPDHPDAIKVGHDQCNALQWKGEEWIFWRWFIWFVLFLSGHVQHRFDHLALLGDRHNCHDWMNSLDIFQLQKLICIICPILCPIADPMRFLQGISLRIDMNFQILETKTCRPEAPS